MLLVLPHAFAASTPCTGEVIFYTELWTKTFVVGMLMGPTGELANLARSTPGNVLFVFLLILVIWTMSSWAMFHRQAMVFVLKEVVARSAVENERHMIRSDGLWQFL